MKVLFLLLVLTASGWAEVMDKEPTLSEIWTGAALLAGFAWALGRRLPWMGWLALLPALAIGSEVSDPIMGQAILREAGPGYVAQTYLAAGLVLLAFMAGLSGRRAANRSLPVQGIHCR